MKASHLSSAVTLHNAVTNLDKVISQYNNDHIKMDISQCVNAVYADEKMKQVIRNAIVTELTSRLHTMVSQLKEMGVEYGV